ncbi:MAG TPA: AraC family transcriptional regulator [Candidatus Polarisedimenticolia bacterium]|nr:AraC family transcriptional regulator [Candidatus Polarisedimenticolia bacterium]
MSSFHGVDLGALTAWGIRCATSVFPPHFSTPPHAHDEAYFCLVMDGAGTQRSGNVERYRERGRAYFYPAGEIQSERFDRSGCRIFRVQLGGEAMRQVREAVRLPNASVELAGPAALGLRKLHIEACRDTLLAVQELAMALIAALCRERCDSVRWGPVVRDFLHSHFTENLTLRQIAAAVGLHPVHLCRAFPERYGVTLGTYLRALRVDYGARLLLGSSRPIAGIALEAGFCSQAHFTRELRKVMGVTPAAYRRMLIL